MMTPRGFADLPAPARYGFVGGGLLGILGGVIGLIVGLVVYAPTAWFAIFELGIPTTMLGFLLGLLVGSLVVAHRRVHSALERRRSPSTR